MLVIFSLKNVEQVSYKLLLLGLYLLLGLLLYDTVFERYGQRTLKIVRICDKDLSRLNKLVSCKNVSFSTSFLRSSTSNLAKKSFMKREHIVDTKKICWTTSWTRSFLYAAFSRSRVSQRVSVFRLFCLHLTTTTSVLLSKPRLWKSRNTIQASLKRSSIISNVSLESLKSQI